MLVDSGIPFLNVRNLQNGQINLQGISFISQEEYERVHKAWKPEEGDVLISRIGTLGIVAVLGKRDMPMAVHYNMLVLKPSLTNTAFLYFLLRSQYFQEAYSSKARQSVQEYSRSMATHLIWLYWRQRLYLNRQSNWLKN